MFFSISVTVWNCSWKRRKNHLNNLIKPNIFWMLRNGWGNFGEKYEKMKQIVSSEVIFVQERHYFITRLWCTSFCKQKRRGFINVETDFAPSPPPLPHLTLNTYRYLIFSLCKGIFRLRRFIIHNIKFGLEYRLKLNMCDNVFT